MTTEDQFSIYSKACECGEDAEETTTLESAWKDYLREVNNALNTGQRLLNDMEALSLAMLLEDMHYRIQHLLDPYEDKLVRKVVVNTTNILLTINRLHTKIHDLRKECSEVLDKYQEGDL